MALRRRAVRSLSRCALAAASVGLLLSAACIRDDPNHCRHQQGDASCEGATPYCNSCLSSEANGGCVAERPAASCAWPGDTPAASTETTAGASSSSGGDATSDATTGSGGPTECTTAGGRDDACPDAAPFCVGGQCADCSAAGGDAWCAELDADHPVCGALGECVQCSSTATAQCQAPTQFCDPNGSCSGCFEHSQCGMAGCDLYSNTCLEENLVYWAEPDICIPESGFGTKSQPYCNLDSIQAIIDGFPSPDQARLTLRLTSGLFTNSLQISGDGAVLVVLADEPGPRLGSDEALRTFNGARVYTQGLVLNGESARSVLCNSNAKVWLRDTNVEGNGAGVGILAQSGCQLTVERGVIARNDGGGIRGSSADITLLSAAIMANGEVASDTHGLHLDGPSTLFASHTTIIENTGDGDGRNVLCTPAVTGTLRNAIVMRTGGLSVSGCSGVELSHSVVDDTALQDAANGVVRVAFQPDFFVNAATNNPHLSPGTPFGDVAVWALGDPRTDLDDEPLATLLGDTNFAGCDQR